MGIEVGDIVWLGYSKDYDQSFSQVPIVVTEVGIEVNGELGFFGYRRASSKQKEVVLFFTRNIVSIKKAKNMHSFNAMRLKYRDKFCELLLKSDF